MKLKFEKFEAKKPIGSPLEFQILQPFWGAKSHLGAIVKQLKSIPKLLL
jgi:hypothetical protein